jgi:hypothetical protein
MGLAERRLTTEFEQQHYPELKKKIDDAAGFEVPIEVRWDTLAASDPKFSKLWIDGWPKIYFAPMIEGFKRIARDQMGKDALKAALKKVVVQNTTTSFASYWAKFDTVTGTLTLDYQVTNIDSIKDRTDVLVKELEKNL